MPTYNAYGQPVPTDADLYADIYAAMAAPTPTTTQIKQDKLSQRADAKKAKLGLYDTSKRIATTTGQGSYDADTLYADGLGSLKANPKTGEVYDGRGKLRLGTPGTGVEGGFVNAPERTGTDVGGYQASVMAKDNFAVGTTQGTAADYVDIKNNPLSPEDWKTYQDSMSQSTVYDDLAVQGNIDQTGYYGRGIGEVYNPNNPGDVNERLQDRLIATDTASIKGGGSTGNSTAGLEAMLAQSLKEGPKATSRLGNLIDATQFGLGRTAAGIADAALDATSQVIQQGFDVDPDKVSETSIFFSKDMFDADGNFTGLDDAKTAAYYGYDNTRTQAVTDNLGKAFDSGSYADMALAVADGVITAGPEFFLESSGEMAAAMSGVPGAVALMSKYSNDMLEERAENLADDEVLSNGDRLMTSALSVPLVLLNKLGADEIVGKTTIVKDVMSKLIASGNKVAAKSAMKELATKGIGVAALTTGKGTYEGLEEIAQESLQKFGEKYGTAAQAELLTSETGKELFQAFGGGFAGGATPGGISAAKDAVVGSDRLQATIGDLKDKTVKAAEKATEAITPDKEYDYSLNTPEDADATAATFTEEEQVTAAEVAVAEPVASVDEPERSIEAQAALNTFDKEFELAVAGLSVTGKALQDAVDTGVAPADAVDNAVEGAVESSTAAIVKAYDEAVAASPGPKATEALNTKMAQIIALQSVKSVTELQTVLDSDTDQDSKVRQVLGSSAATITQLEQVASYETITPNEQKLVEAKIEVLKTFEDVAGEKLIGGGSKPGVFQWMTLLQEGAAGEFAQENIQSFVDGQDRKLKALEDARDVYNAKGDGKKVAAKYGSGFYYDGSDYLIEKLTKENQSTKALAKLAADIVSTKKATPAAQKPTKEPQTPAESTNTPDATQTPSEQDIGQEEDLFDGPPIDDIQMDDEIEVNNKPAPTNAPANEQDDDFFRGTEDVDTAGMDEQDGMQEPTMDEQRDTQRPVKKVAKEAKAKQTVETLKKSFMESMNAAVKAAGTLAGEVKALKSPDDMKAFIEKYKAKPAVKAVVAHVTKALADFSSYKLKQGKPVKETTISIDELMEAVDAAELTISELEFERGQETDVKAKARITKQIAKERKAIDKLVVEIGLEGTVGDRILSNPSARKKKADLMRGEKDTQLADYFEAKAVNNNLNISEDLFGADFDALANTIEVKEGEELYFDGAKEQTLSMIETIEAMVSEDFNQATIDDADVAETVATNRFQSISRLLLKGSPRGTGKKDLEAGKVTAEGYTLPKEVVTAIALAADDWLVTQGGLRASMRTEEDTKRMLNKAPGETLTMEEKVRVADVDAFMSNAANSIGGVIYKNLGLRVKDKEGDNRELLEGKMKTELGLMAIAAMRKDGRIEVIPKSGEEIFGKGNDTTGGKGVNVVKYTDKGSDLLDDRTKLFAPNSRFANKMVGTETSVRNPSFEPPTGPRGVKISSEAGEFYDVAAKSQEAINKMEDTPWDWTSEYVDSYTEMVKTDKGRERLKKLLGWKDPDAAHIELRAGINGKNSAIESNMQYLEELSQQMEISGDEQMWFPWKFVKNGRFILDTNTFNPQGKKLHRFAVNAGSVKITKANSKYQELALAMGFGVDIDKMSEKKALAEWAGIKPQLDAMIDNGDSDIDILEAADKNHWSHDMEHTMGGLAEYRLYKEYVAKNGSAIGMESRLPMETDAITSGYILKSLQMPLLEDINTALEKGGVFQKDSKYKSYGKQAEQDDYTDAYNTPAKVMSDLIKPVQDTLTSGVSDAHKTANKRATELALGADVDGQIETISRNFMKSPFMTFNYGSGLGNIVNAIGDTAIENLYKMVGSNDAQVQAVLDSAGVTYNYDTKAKAWVATKADPKVQAEVAKFASEYKNASAKQRLEMRLPTVVEENIKSSIAAGVGVALDETFTKTYGVYIEAGNTINASFTAMFRLFKAKVDTAIEAKQLELGKDGKKRHLTSDEVNEVINTMKESLPAIKTALSDDNINSQLMIYKTESTYFDSLDGEVVDNGQGRIKFNEKGMELSAQAKAYQLIEAAASGAVVPIHYLDGSIQSIVGTEFAALGVHDANMFNAENALEGTRTYNKATAELSADYSLTMSILSSLNESINNATDEEIALVDAAYKKEAEDKGFDPDNAPNINEVHTGMSQLANNSENARETLFSNELTFEHAALEGSEYVRPAGYTKQTPDVTLNKREGMADQVAVANEVEVKTEDGYNAETKTALLELYSKPGIATMLSAAGINLKDC